jgi:hypothetical protein
MNQYEYKLNSPKIIFNVRNCQHQLFIETYSAVLASMFWNGEITFHA